MLKEISCDQFIKNGQPRGPIIFRNGLNTIIGGTSGTNSIGKSTLLLIIDFAFGGDDYMTVCEDAQRNVGEHVIKWKMEFEGKGFFFSRATARPGKVDFCDEKYVVQETRSVEGYCQWLQGKYEINNDGQTFRNTVSRHIRVFGRENLDVKKPLATAKREKEQVGIEGLLMLFNRYSEVHQYTKRYNEAHLEEQTFKNGLKFKHQTAAANQTEVGKNEKRILLLQEEQGRLIQRNDSGLLELSAMQREQLRKLTDKRRELDRRRNDLQQQLSAILADREADEGRFTRNYDALTKYFSNINIELLKSVEKFHKGVTNALKKEFEESVADLEGVITLLNDEIEDLELQMTEVAEVPNLPEMVLVQYADNDREMKDLQKNNDNFRKKEALIAETKKRKDELNDVLLRAVAELQDDLNNGMRELNDYVIVGRRTRPPMITVESNTSYIFYTPNDSGAGASYKGMILFDLACLRMTNLPFIAHDSFMLSNIEMKTLERILELYNQGQKQIFVTLDKEGTYSERSQEIMNDTVILRLERGGNELFGRSWNEEK